MAVRSLIFSNFLAISRGVEQSSEARSKRSCRFVGHTSRVFTIVVGRRVSLVVGTW